MTAFTRIAHAPGTPDLIGQAADVDQFAEQLADKITARLAASMLQLAEPIDCSPSYGNGVTQIGYGYECLFLEWRFSTAGLHLILKHNSQRVIWQATLTPPVVPSHP